MIVCEPRQEILLNGWWDILPIDHTDLAKPIEPKKVPTTGWHNKAYLVPGFFTDQFYPQEWRKSRSAWMRTTFQMSEAQAGQRAVLTIKGAIPQAHVFINGKPAGVQNDMFIGDALDITPTVRVGENKLAIFLTEFETFPHPETGTPSLIDVPWGCCISTAQHKQAGIWQDVTLEWRPQVAVEDVTIRTSYRENSLTVIAEVANFSGQEFAGVLTLDVIGGVQIPPQAVQVSAGQTRRLEITVPWEDFIPWTPENPHRYTLAGSLTRDNTIIDAFQERFGFREIWIQFHNFILNDKPVHWFGEWGHKNHSHWLRPEYVRQWYQQLKDLNMNYVRMHTFPHPEYFLEIADEMGIMVCQESALYGSGEFGYDSERLWHESRQHVRRMVKRDKNHPSLVLWSVENEMRWSLRVVPGAKQQLPELKKLFNELDPTRAAYHEGDSSLWNEVAQEVISRHYGNACHGWGWWDRQKPLHAGEMGRWHYGSPFTALIWKGDEVFADYAEMSRSIALEAGQVAELGRASGVSCLFMWNTSGLDNFRPAEARSFTWETPNSPAMKPLAHKPYESEYAWWEEGKGYRPGSSFEILRQVFRPFALVCLEERPQCYSDRRLPHSVFLINDLPDPVEGFLRVRIEQERKATWEKMVKVTVPAGRSKRVDVEVRLDTMLDTGDAQVVSLFLGTDAKGKSIRDEVVRRVWVDDISMLNEPLAWTLSTALTLVSAPVVIYGTTALQGWFSGHGIPTRQIEAISGLNPAEAPVLLVSEGSIQPGTDQNQHLEAYVRQGGRVLLLEQTCSAFPGLAIERKPVEIAWMRDRQHPVLTGMVDDDFRFYGDDLYGLPSSNAWVTQFPYIKPRGSQLVRPLVDSSGGDFKDGGLTWSPLLEMQLGEGTLIACQLRIADRSTILPSVDHLLRNIFTYLSGFIPMGNIPLLAGNEQAEKLHQALPQLQTTPDDASLAEVEAFRRIRFFNGDRTPDLDAPTLASRAAAGETVLVWQLTEETRSYWEEVTGSAIHIWQPEHPVYHLVRQGESPLLRGISNEDTCWLENWQYQPVSLKEQIIETLLDVEKGSNLLTNSDRSGLDILFGDDKFSEVDRMAAMSAFFDAEPPRLGGGMVEVRLGEGRVVFCQMRWRADKWQIQRFLGLLLWNLGIQTCTNVLQGGSTPLTGLMSQGYPEKLLAASAIAEEDLQEIISRGRAHVESYAGNTVFQEWTHWKSVDLPGGVLSARDVAGGEDGIIGIQVTSPEPRKMMNTVGGLPNPDLQTFLRLHGSGSVEAWVNGKPRGTCNLTPAGSGTIPDIDLEAGVNFVVLRWSFSSPEDQLSIRFEDKEHNPETSFGFV